MNTNPIAKRVLCFGDSNTWGFMPGLRTRYEAHERWTGLLQQKLGSDYEVIEEGLNARTTVIDDPNNEGKNGLTYLTPCLESHNPLDLVILFLGTNDLKERFSRTPVEIAAGIEQLIRTIKDKAVNRERKKPKLILVCPAIVSESVAGVQEKYLGAEAKSRQLPTLYRAIAKNQRIGFVNLQEHVEPSSVDGYHLERDAHYKVAALLSDLVLKQL